MSKKFLILCTGNSCRSQIAEAILKSLDPALEVHSAGTNPAAHVHPNTVLVMREIGMDLTRAKPKSVDQFLDQEFDYVITVCDQAKESCPAFYGEVHHRLHFGFEDPASARGAEADVLEEFRRTRDEIRSTFSTFFLTLQEKK
jgi:arsenate reductase